MLSNDVSILYILCSQIITSNPFVFAYGSFIESLGYLFYYQAYAKVDFFKSSRFEGKQPRIKIGHCVNLGHDGNLDLVRFFLLKCLDYFKNVILNSRRLNILLFTACVSEYIVCNFITGRNFSSN